MKVELRKDSCIVRAEAGDMRICDESHFFYRVKLALIEQGHDVVKRRMTADGHLTDSTRFYVRERGWRFSLVDEYWTWRPVEVEYRHKGIVHLAVVRWENIVE